MPRSTTCRVLVWALVAICLALGASESRGTEPDSKTEPLLSGRDGVSEPVLIQSSKVRPIYPRKARRVRANGKVILQAVVRKSGRVRVIEVLESSRPGLGFEKAAIKSVKQWRWTPAELDGEPVDVYFTVVVEFNLSRR